jgi:hypothetical protein
MGTSSRFIALADLEGIIGQLFPATLLCDRNKSGN